MQWAAARSPNWCSRQCQTRCLAQLQLQQQAARGANATPRQWARWTASSGARRRTRDSAPRTACFARKVAQSALQSCRKHVTICRSIALEKETTTAKCLQLLFWSVTRNARASAPSVHVLRVSSAMRFDTVSGPSLPVAAHRMAQSSVYLCVQHSAGQPNSIWSISTPRSTAREQHISGSVTHALLPARPVHTVRGAALLTVSSKGLSGNLHPGQRSVLKAPPSKHAGINPVGLTCVRGSYSRGWHAPAASCLRRS